MNLKQGYPIRMHVDITKYYPFTGRYFDLDSLALAYLDERVGEPVVMLHGNPTWSSTIAAWYGLPTASACIVPDLSAAVSPDKPGGRRYTNTLRQRVDDLERLLDHLGIEGNHPGLHDWGG